MRFGLSLYVYQLLYHIFSVWNVDLFSNHQTRLIQNEEVFSLDVSVMLLLCYCLPLNPSSCGGKSTEINRTFSYPSHPNVFPF